MFMLYKNWSDSTGNNTQLLQIRFKPYVKTC